MIDQPITYKVIFSGSTLDGNHPSDVAQRFSKAFKLNDLTSLKQIFSGNIITLKRGLEYDQAKRYSRILQKLGADCCIELEQQSMFSDIEQDHDDELKIRRRRLAELNRQTSRLTELSLSPK